MRRLHTLSTLLLLFALAACQPGGGGYYRGNSTWGSGLNSGSNNNSNSNGSNSNNSGSNNSSNSATAAAQRRCDQIFNVTQRVQWNCHAVFVDFAEEISTSCKRAWNSLYTSGYCDLDAVNGTIRTCKTDLQTNWAHVPSGCRSALSPWIN